MTDHNNEPDVTRDEYDAMMIDLDVVQDVSKGTGHMRSQRTKYLPQHPAEDNEDYTSRLNRSLLFNAVERTVKGLSGMVFREDPQLSEDVPTPIIEHTENIDNAGTHLDVFAKELFSNCLQDGHTFVLVDFPKVEEGLTLAEERDRKIRPYWVPVSKRQVINWDTSIVDGRQILNWVVIHEPTTVNDGLFGHRTADRFRVLRREALDANVIIVFQLFEKKDDEFLLVADGVIQNQTEIPLVPFYSGKTGFFTSRPPLLDLAWTNVAHYQVQSDHLQSLHKASLPIFTVIGGPQDEDFIAGPNTGLALPMGATAEYVEHEGKALGQTRTQLQDFKTEMATLGLGLLQPETRAAETAEAKRLDKSEQDSALATAARSLQDGLENTLQFHSNFLKLDAGGSVTVSRDFDRFTLSAQEVQAYSAMVATSQLSLETLYAVLQEGGVLPDDFDAEIERDRIAQGFLVEPTGEGV